MPSAPAQPAAVLDYAATTPQEGLLRRLGAGAIVLLCMVLCGGIGWFVGPSAYRAFGLMQIDPARGSIPMVAGPSVEVNARTARQAAAVTALTSPANLNAAVAQLPLSMMLTPGKVPANLKVRPVPESRLIMVSFEHDDDPSWGCCRRQCRDGRGHGTAD